MTTMNGESNPIYLDYNATTPLAPTVLEAITNALRDDWGNPSSKYKQGRTAKNTVDNARKAIAEMIGASSEEIVFMSGGTEANHMVFHSLVTEFRESGTTPHIISCPIEHDAVILPLSKLEKRGDIELTLLPIDSNTGAVNPDDVRAALKKNTRLVTLMLANNETGAIQPISDIADIISTWNSPLSNVKEKVLFHTDAAQAIGKVKVNVNDLQVDYLTIVGHKFYGPRIGALYVRNNFLESRKHVPLHPLFFGGGQEKGLRPGTENTGMIAGLGQAAKLVSDHLDIYSANMERVRNCLETHLTDLEIPVRFNHRFKCGKSLPNTCSVSFINAGISGRRLLELCPGISASVGAACHSSSSDKPSHILLESGVPEDIARCTLRLSVGRETTEDEIDAVVNEISNAFKTISQPKS